VIQIEISEEEKTLLKTYIKTTPLLLIRYKCQALLMRSKGVKLEDIGDIVSRNENTVGRWLADWKERRMASIFTGHKDNKNAGKLTKEQREEIKEVLSKSPRAHGIPKEFWDVPTLKKYVEAKFGVVYESDQSYYFLLKLG
jgi:transposase